MGRKRKHCNEEEEESLFLNIAPDMFRLIVSFLDDKSLYAVSAANRQTYEKTQPVFQARFLRDCPAWPLSELAKKIKIGGIIPTDRSWAAIYKMTKSKLSFVDKIHPIDINPKETEMLFDVAVTTADDKVCSVLSSGTAFMRHDCEFHIEMPQFEVNTPLLSTKKKGCFIRLGIRAYIINQNLRVVKIIHTEETRLGKYAPPWPLENILYGFTGGAFTAIHGPFGLFLDDILNVVTCSSNGTLARVSGSEYQIQEVFDSIIWH